METFQERIVIFMELLLAGRRQRRQRAAVEGIIRSDDLVAAFAVDFASVFARQFDGPFIGFRAAVAEKDLIQNGIRDQFFRQLHLRLDPIKVRAVDQFGCLFRYRSRHFRMIMS